MLLMLRGDGQGLFRRFVRDQDGNVVQVLEFPPHKPVDVSEDLLPVVEADIGHALIEVQVDQKQRVRVVKQVEPPADEQDPPLDVETSGEAAGDATTERLPRRDSRRARRQAQDAG